MTKTAPRTKPPRIPKITAEGHSCRRLTQPERDYLEGRARSARKRLQTVTRESGPSHGMTAQQLAKAGDQVEQETMVPAQGPVKAVVRQRLTPTIDRYKQYFSASEQEALRRFVDDAERATTVNLTMTYDGIPANAPGPRRGGVSDYNRAAHNRLQIIKGALPERCIEICKHLVLAIRDDAVERELSIHQVAQSHATHLRRKEALGFFGAGLLVATVWMLEYVYRCIDKGTVPDSALMVQLWAERRARAQTG
ncbi:MAG: hypothetical protein GDA50_04135 [Alphaproteobacteria bacterium GM202ARS2]|nr:hypothetical protein [Alphaproteobacteria bacterium GM202ARS2]